LPDFSYTPFTRLWESTSTRPNAFRLISGKETKRHAASLFVPGKKAREPECDVFSACERIGLVQCEGNSMGHMEIGQADLIPTAVPSPK
jgi:hypothetical protein